MWGQELHGNSPHLLFSFAVYLNCSKNYLLKGFIFHIESTDADGLDPGVSSEE